MMETSKLFTVEDNQMRESSANKKYHGEIVIDSTAAIYNSDTTDVKGTNPSDVVKNEGDFPVSMCEANGALRSEEETNKVDIRSGDDVKQKTRVPTPETRARSLSPGGEFKDGQNKRAAVICEFYAKGWCIKGSSCRFLHKKDRIDKPNQPPDGEDITASNQKNGVHITEGARNSAERSNFSCPSEPLASSLLGNSKYSSPFSSGNQMSHHFNISAWKFSLPFRSLSADTNKLLDNERNYSYASRSVSSIPFSVAEMEHLPLRDRFAGERGKISPNDWEPSIPFRPSFLVTQRILFPESQYDPLRDSIEQPDDNHKLHDSALDKKSDSRGRNLVTTETENKYSTSRGEDPMNSVRVNDVTETHKMVIDNNGAAQKKMEVEKRIEYGEVTSVCNTDDQESKVKNFRSALVDFVKDQVKPAWRRGRVSKDAHKMIVKKTVEKVLGTIQLNQIPNTVDLTQQYLSSLQPKIVKLVRGYIEKYAKSSAGSG